MHKCYINIIIYWKLHVAHNQIRVEHSCLVYFFKAQTTFPCLLHITDIYVY